MTGADATPVAETPRPETRRAAAAWLVLGTLQSLMAAMIGIWMVVSGKVLTGSAILLLAGFIVFAVRWKRARLLRPA